MLLTNTNTIVNNIYFLLWLKDTGLKENTFNIRIPDTVIFKNRNAAIWYYSTSDGKILKHKKSSLTVQQIYEKYTNPISKSEITSYLVYEPENDLENKYIEHQSAKNNNQQSSKQSTDWLWTEENYSKGRIIIKYFNKQQLHEFLFDEEKNQMPLNGILQKFIDPYGDHHSLIQAIWSPTSCVFSKRVNWHNLFNTKYEIYERAVTFDGGEIHSRTVAIQGQEISQAIRNFCETIVDKISAVTYQRINISRMVIYFKADNKNRIILLFCTSLRIKEEQQVQYKYTNIESQTLRRAPIVIDNNFSIPQEIKNTYTVNTTKPSQLVKDIHCITCKELMQKCDLIQLTYDYIIQMQEQDELQNKVNEKQSKNNLNQNIQHNSIFDDEITNQNNKRVDVEQIELLIPSFIKHLYPKMSFQSYQKMKSNSWFLNQTALICSNCYIYYTKKNYIISGETPQSKMTTQGSNCKLELLQRDPKLNDQILQMCASKNELLANQNPRTQFLAQSYDNMVKLYQNQINHRQLKKKQEFCNNQRRLKTQQSQYIYPKSDQFNIVDKNQNNQDQQQELKELAYNKQKSNAKMQALLGKFDSKQNYKVKKQQQYSINFGSIQYQKIQEVLERHKSQLSALSNSTLPTQQQSTQSQSGNDSQFQSCNKSNVQFFQFKSPKSSMSQYRQSQGQLQVYFTPKNQTRPGNKKFFESFTEDQQQQKKKIQLQSEKSIYKEDGIISIYNNISSQKQEEIN